MPDRMTVRADAAWRLVARPLPSRGLPEGVTRWRVAAAIRAAAPALGLTASMLRLLQRSLPARRAIADTARLPLHPV